MKSYRDVKSSIPRRRTQLPHIGVSFGIGSINSGLSQRKELSTSFKLHGRQGERKKEETEKISIEDLKGWVVNELSFLVEEKGKAGLETNKAKWLLDFIPDVFKEEILKKILKGGQGE